MNRLPILLIGYNRPDFIVQRLKEISTVLNHCSTTVYISIDGPKTLQDVENSRAIHKLIMELDLNHKIKLNQVNLGLSKNVTSAISWVLNLEEKVLIIEDDISLSLSAYRIFAEIPDIYLSKYVSVSGFTCIPMSRSKIKNISFYESKYFAAWGWIIHRDTWQFYKRELSTEDIYQLDKSKLWKASSEKEREIWLKRFKQIIINPDFTWDTQMQYLNFLLDKKNLRSSIRLVENIGFNDSRSTNTKEKKPFWYFPVKICPNVDNIAIKLSNSIMTAFYEFLDSFTVSGTRKFPKRFRLSPRKILIK